MKKIMMAVLLLATVSLCHAQTGQVNPTPKNENPTPQQVVDLLNMSLQANGAFTLEDINYASRFHTGDPFTFVRQDGTDTTFLFELGDSPWKMGVRVLKNENPNNRFVKPGQSDSTDEDDAIVPLGGTNDSGGFPWWLLALFILGGVLIAAIVADKKRMKAKKEKARQTEQPALVPLVANGVNDAQAPAYMRNVARRKNFTITGPTERILLTTVRPIMMDYYGGVTNMESFTNEPFFRAAARNNETGEPCTAYFRQVCGNDGTCLDENDVIITPMAEQSPAIRQANAAVGTPMQTVAMQQTVQPVTEKSSFMAMAEVVEKEKNAGNNPYFRLNENGEIVVKIPGAGFSVNGQGHADLVKKDQPAMQVKEAQTSTSN